MNQGLRHEEMQEMLPAAALEILEGAELERVLAHARACAECGQLLEEYRQVTAALSLQLPEAGQLDSDRSALLRARLLAKARAKRSRVGPGSRRAAASKRLDVFASTSLP